MCASSPCGFRRSTTRAPRAGAASGFPRSTIWWASWARASRTWAGRTSARTWPNTLNELAKYRAGPVKPGALDIAKLAKGTGEGLDDGRVKRFLEAVWAKPKLSAAEGHCIMNICMAATYDPDPKAPNGFRMPFNLETGEALAERWKRWRANDPVNLVAKYRRNLESLHGIYVDCGSRDQYHIHYGSRIPSKLRL